MPSECLKLHYLLIKFIVRSHRIVVISNARKSSHNVKCFPSNFDLIWDRLLYVPTVYSLGLLRAPKAPAPEGGRRPSVCGRPCLLFFQAKRRVGIKRRAMSFGKVVGMDENSMMFLADGDPTIGSGITGHQSSEFNR